MEWTHKCFLRGSWHPPRPPQGQRGRLRGNINSCRTACPTTWSSCVRVRQTCRLSVPCVFGDNLMRFATSRLTLARIYTGKQDDGPRMSVLQPRGRQIINLRRRGEQLHAVSSRVAGVQKAGCFVDCGKAWKAIVGGAAIDGGAVEGAIEGSFKVVVVVVVVVSA